MGVKFENKKNNTLDGIMLLFNLFSNLNLNIFSIVYQKLNIKCIIVMHLCFVLLPCMSLSCLIILQNHIVYQNYLKVIVIPLG